MASGALERTGADRAVSISGVAGPGGGTARNPVGSVWFGFAVREGNTLRTSACHRQFVGDRDAVRRHAVLTALVLLRG